MKTAWVALAVGAVASGPPSYAAETPQAFVRPAPAAASRRGAPPPTASIDQRTEGANSPNISGDGATVIYNPPAPAPEPRSAELLGREGVSSALDGSHIEELTFWNSGTWATYLLDILILDADGREVASFKRPNDRITPALPINIEPRHVAHLTVRITPNESMRAAWLQWRGEQGLSQPISWADRRLRISLGVAIVASATMTATLTVSKLVVRQEYQRHGADGVAKVITFTNSHDVAVAVQDLGLFDDKGHEVVALGRSRAGINPALPLNVEPHEALQVTIELPQEQAARGRWLEWEEDGIRHRIEWAPRGASMITGTSAPGGAKSAGVSTAIAPPSAAPHQDR
jgi:hypothetical protein